MVRLLLFVLIVFCTLKSGAQDIPLFSQKLSNALIYNPAMAGSTFGSATYTFRRNYNGVAGSPQDNLLSIHTPLLNYRMGVGGTVYQEQVNFIRTTYSSIAFAYHIHFDKYTFLSMGVSGEYRSLGIVGISNTVGDDQVLDAVRTGKENKFDVSYGMNFQNRFIKIGLSANRLATQWANSGGLQHGYFAGSVQGIFHVRNDEDLLEPFFMFRKFSDVNDTYDLGLYYTIKDKIILGVASRNNPSGTLSGMILNTTLGFKPTKQLVIGYTNEIIFGGYGGYVGTANEITLRYDFNNKAYKETFRSNYKEAVSFRRKTMNHVSTKSSPGKMKAYSPNTRYQNVKKLSSGKKSSSSKKKYKKPKGRKFTKRY